jgi:hypothetical protein
MMKESRGLVSIVITPTLALPQSMGFRNIRLYIFSAVFIGLDILVPWLTHHLGGIQAGSIFLPIFFFVLLAGTLGGWKAGIVVGLLTPSISFSITGMPPLTLLPEITVTCLFYGLVAGFMRQKLQLRVVWAVLAATASSWLVRLGVIFLFHSLGLTYGYGGDVLPLAYFSGMFIRGLPGIAVALVLVPLITVMVEKRYKSDKEKEHVA